MYFYHNQRKFKIIFIYLFIYFYLQKKKKNKQKTEIKSNTTTQQSSSIKNQDYFESIPTSTVEQIPTIECSTSADRVKKEINPTKETSNIQQNIEKTAHEQTVETIQDNKTLQDNVEPPIQCPETVHQYDVTNIYGSLDKVGNKSSEKSGEESGKSIISFITSLL